MRFLGDVGQREQVRKTQRLHQEQTHQRLKQDHHERRHFRRLKIVGDVVAATDHGRHRQRDQLEVDEGTADRDQDHHERDTELD